MFERLHATVVGELRHLAHDLVDESEARAKPLVLVTTILSLRRSFEHYRIHTQTHVWNASRTTAFLTLTHTTLAACSRHTLNGRPHTHEADMALKRINKVSLQSYLVIAMSGTLYVI